MRVHPPSVSLALAILLAVPTFTSAAKPAAPAAADPMVAGEAAYKAHDAMAIFAAYGPLIMDGDLPEDGNVWDRLALASAKAHSTDGMKDVAQDYWERSRNSGTRTGRVVLDEWRKAVYTDHDGDAFFKEALGFGTWFSAVAYSALASFQVYDHYHKSAVQSYAKAVALEPSPTNIEAHSGMVEGFDKDAKKRLAALWKGVALAEAAGDYDSKAHAALSLGYGKEYKEWLKQFSLIDQLKRGRWAASIDEDPVEACVGYFLKRDADGFNKAFTRAIEKQPNSPVPWHYKATWMALAGKADPAKVDEQFGEALKRDPDFAPSLINRSLVLRKQGKLDEALASVNRGVAIDPRLLMPQGLSNRAVILEEMKRYDEALAEWNAMLARQPNNALANRGRVVTLAKAGRTAEALRMTAALVAFQPTPLNYALRAEMLGANGDHANAAQNYLIAMQNDEKAYQDLQPYWSAAVESHRQAHCETPPANLLELIRPLTTYVRPAGDLSVKYVSVGLRTQWQADGSLRLWTQKEPGIYLLADGVKFQRAIDKGGRGAVEAPKLERNGKTVYPLGEFSLVFFPSGAFYFGVYGPVAASSQGRYVECSGMALSGPFLAGMSVHAIDPVAHSTTTRSEGGKPRTSTRTTLSNGLVHVTEKGQEPGSEVEHTWTWLEMPGMGTFRGTLNDRHVPQTGVFTDEDGRRSIVWEGNFLATGAAGQELNYTIDYKRSIKLHPSGLLAIKLWGYQEDHFVVYDGTGREPYEQIENKPPIVYAPPPVVEEPEPPAPSGSAYSSFKFKDVLNGGAKPRLCYRCRGAGQIWIGGGASQSSRSAPSGLTAGQAESWRNSAASIGVTYTSGHMEKCPRCDGSGGR